METTHDAPLFTAPRSRREAHRRAAWRTRMADELFRYVVVSLALIVLVRPIGVIVAVVWGLRLARRFYRGRVGPRLHRRFVDEELRRCGHPAREARPRPAEPERLAVAMGDDPRARGAIDWARTALAELDRVEGDPGADRTDLVCVADVVEDVMDACEGRADREGIDLRLEVDAEGAVATDARRLKAVLLELVGDSLRALGRGAQGPGRIQLATGENLAGSEVWVRIRDDRRAPDDGERGSWGSRPVPGLPGATLETRTSPSDGAERVLTLRKDAPARDTNASGASARDTNASGAGARQGETA